MTSVNQGIGTSIPKNVAGQHVPYQGGSLNAEEKYLRGVDTMEDTIFLWFNNFIKIEKSSPYFKEFSEKKNIS